MTPMLGKITLFPYEYAPRGWMFCEGAVLPIGDNESLFMLLGNRFGGDGENTFGLPDLRSITPPDCHYCIAVQGKSGVMNYEGLVGETFFVPFKSHPHDLLECAGQSVPKSQYPLLSLLMGNRFGGDDANLNLPDLRSKAPTIPQTMMAVQGYNPNSRSPRDLYIGELVLMPYDRVEGLLVCDGTTLPVNSYTALFTLLGVRFGGDPRRFAVPDLRAKAPARYNYFILLRDGTYPPRD